MEESPTSSCSVSGDPDRRANLDRRRRRTRPFAAFTTPARRRGFRRAGERLNAYVDRPSGHAIAWALGLIALSAVDALLTLFHVEAGGGELVPTMRLALDHGQTTFVTAKMAVTALGVVVLVVHENFRLAHYASRFVFLAYCSVMGYHAALIALR